MLISNKSKCSILSDEVSVGDTSSTSSLENHGHGLPTVIPSASSRQHNHVGANISGLNSTGPLTASTLAVSKQMDLSAYNCHNEIQSSQEALTTAQETNRNGFTIKLVLASIVAFFTNSLHSGFNMGVVNTPEMVFKDVFNATFKLHQNDITSKQIDLAWSLAVSFLVIGALVTSVFTGNIANIIGRRGLILANCFVGLLGVFLCWAFKYIPNVAMFMSGRLISGFHTGIASSVVPMYLMEIAPKELLASLGAIHVMGLNGGIMVAQIMGLENILGSPSRWQILFFVNAVFIMFGLLIFYYIPESPFYLFVIKKDEKRAIQVLQDIRKTPVEDMIDDIATLKQEQKNVENSKTTFWSLLKQKDFCRNLLIVCTLHAGQQLIGINAVFYYSTMTFKSIGLSHSASQFGSIGCAFLNTLSALISLRLIRTVSPKRMILVSTIGTTLGLILLTLTMNLKTYSIWFNYATIFNISFYVFVFGLGQGNIPFMIGGELFDRSSMAIGLSCGCFTNWLCNFVVAFAFPTLVGYMHQNVFIIFIVFDMLLLLFIMFVVPETRLPTKSECEPKLEPNFVSILSKK